MLIPSIDLMEGKIVQLVQGEKKALEFGNFSYWIERFSRYPLVQLIDLDAAMDKGNNHALAAMICKKLTCQVGGGIRNVKLALELIELGAKRVIFGSALLKENAINSGFAQEASARIGTEQLTFAIDSRQGKVAVKGWKEKTAVDPIQMMQALEPYCSAFLYTHIDTEGTMTGFPIAVAQKLKAATSRRLIVAGGIKSMDEVDELDRIGADAVVGMAVYKGVVSA